MVLGRGVLDLPPLNRSGSRVRIWGQSVMETIIKESVWRELFEQGWGKKPQLFRAACSPELFSTSLFLQALENIADLLRDGHPAKLRIYDSDGICKSADVHSRSADSGVTRYLPDPLDGSMDKYLERLSRDEKFDEFGIIVDAPHVHHDRIWLLLRGILDEMYRYVGMPKQHIHSDAFIGNYKTTPFGIHKDPLHNLMFMAQGTRSMSFWLDAPDGASHDASAKQAFEVRPGDLLYWPPQYWHMGENSRDVAISINVDYMDYDAPDWAARTAANA